jgi:ribonuclease HII
LVRECWRIDGDEPLTFFIDKHGGRNTYAAMLQDAVPEGMVLAHHESMAGSVYSVAGVKRVVRWTFQPRADAEHFSVALASMVSKYVREVLMGEFNRFWCEQVPGLKPTAGYPGDARRFFDAIRPAAERLGIPEAALWRRK